MSLVISIQNHSVAWKLVATSKFGNSTSTVDRPSNWLEYISNSAIKSFSIGIKYLSFSIRWVLANIFGNKELNCSSVISNSISFLWIALLPLIFTV